VRLFLAVHVSQEAKDSLLGAQRAIERCAPGFYRWVDPAQMHLTLYFLGEMPEAEAVVRALEEVEAGPLTIQVAGLLVLPAPNVPKILAAAIGGDLEGLRRLQQRVADTVFPLAEHKETRAFSPHVTLGRLKKGMPGYAKALKRALADVAVFPSDPFNVVEFALVRSDTRPDGPSYETIQRFALG
jgi:2'-5' RNA ligase